MHGISAHSALAIKRQRRRFDPQKNRKRRGSQQTDHYEGDNKVMGTITMFHVGAVFLLLAAFLMLGALMTSESRKETAELVGTGIICLVIGLFLIVLNRFYGQKEEDDLANYVETRLGRSRSGQRLYHEQESMQELGGGASTSASMESGMSQEVTKSKWGKRGKKNKNRGIEDTDIQTAAVNGSQSPMVKVDMVNEHNQYNSTSPYHNDITSSANVTLDRIAEEGGGGGCDPQISYVNTSYEDMASRGASNNLYRVYDRDSYSRGGGV